ncbi:helix-turn-helix transcriptional regulator [Elizabethkingia anophelis]|uniref:AraC family transcriptional regulator n=3 Tax=Elizabethkingia anophelis TaxID=1117645 RepID=A0A1T3DW36_9FLAO|nr:MULTISPECIES: AraC family transcriptional regulator [Elizabethkingia]AKH95052.1 hypothetical protein M876_10795 [Elizabethkingia anophelis FMS-007]AMR41237.1 AraC family transcriptional regulator [Elizabethkingia anophelis]AMX47878.1 AraC family transcriptional regulator [Elizabethkingia anophelis]AMX51334.1 AraC family transcriptional regulator [Elizabethkingia anophelis]AMX54730.1 AraC family transcriptional regulator [Elizabethkingia anophelis]
MVLLIKGMVCFRCIYVLDHEISNLGYEILNIRLGRVVINSESNVTPDLMVIKSMLNKHGFELLYDKNEKIVEEIKIIVEDGIQQQFNQGIPVKFSLLISSILHKDYDSLSSLFSSLQGLTLEKYIIHRKIEKVKELLVYTNQSLSDIAYAMGYSSPSHLSNQLKKYTGFTSSYYKQIRRDKMSLM